MKNVKKGKKSQKHKKIEIAPRRSDSGKFSESRNWSSGVWSLEFGSTLPALHLIKVRSTDGTGVWVGDMDRVLGLGNGGTCSAAVDGLDWHEEEGPQSASMGFWDGIPAPVLATDRQNMAWWTLPVWGFLVCELGWDGMGWDGSVQGHSSCQSVVVTCEASSVPGNVSWDPAVIAFGSFGSRVTSSCNASIPT